MEAGGRVIPGLSLICWLFSHPEPMWAVTARGTGFRCPKCFRFRVSNALR